ncbi:uncharacterized protein LOC132746131 [Ruditapes philippinarum]|uniref:uncharacterized protein LOC132746131 n=1 Tax=Ruditapes philippinarum TaxID=129788 RepID=UPI00295B4110|nr:uncharacterized protein LOC132746131 [Ruditapes philippinarum]XP_060591192.1 uncharacterized protein LOC132746131 [Ruditapes philippinarum]
MEVSCLVSDILDCIGYNEEIISTRRKYWQNYMRVFNSVQQELSVVVAGSKAEGITSLYESDTDQMLLFNDAICANDIQHLPPVSDFTTLHADTRETPPGYTRLKMISCLGEDSKRFLQESSFKSGSNKFISSSLFLSSIMRETRTTDYCNDIIQIGELSGPAVSRKVMQHLSYDQVVAFPCYCPKILQTWKRRRRLYSWPPVDVREAAASMPAQVVPVGSKLSDDQGREWRFCFILSELELTCSLNETQIKLYILLKMVAKDILKNVSKGISSYMMKNVTFWMSELLPKELFRKENLINLLFLSLVFLKKCVSYSNGLPYYMIPGRNLLAEKLTPDSRQPLCDLIGTLIAEGPRFILLRCNKLRAASGVLISSPTSLKIDGRRRNMIEKLIYLQIILSMNMKDESLISAVVLERMDLLEWEEIVNNCTHEENFALKLEEKISSILS